MAANPNSTRRPSRRLQQLILGLAVAGLALAQPRATAAVELFRVTELLLLDPCSEVGSPL